MAELLKDVYSKSFINSVASHFQKAYSGFEKDQFITTIFDAQWQSRELKSRLTFIAQTLHQFLPKDFKQSSAILTKVAPHFGGYEAMFFPAFIELYGLDDYKTSIECLAFLTRYSSSEFAVRPFIIKFPDQMMAQMVVWANSDNFHIRRLASEGCRSRLPWACSLPKFKKDPTAIIAILEILKDDDEDYVYRSVANNLNDISKDNPELVVKIAQMWMQGNPSKNRVWLVKHGCRSLLKSAHPEVLSLFGFSSPEHIKVEDFELDKQVKMGENLNFSFILNANRVLGKCRLEFVIAFMKKNGKQADKIFKISESDIKVSNKKITKKFSFKAISTRKYYAGAHQLTILVNGVRLASKPFELI
ncbi:MAG: DNA alkylation repair protein [Psychromonas sp.]|nr:DNA alkylation repair protein [Alteromonadales bacterium]MCP5079558.1 DNA alkylation repair protein [Psychromonas sp.]